MATDLIGVLSGVVVGGFVSFVVSLCLWKIQHRDTVRDSQEQEERRERVRTAQKLQDIGSQLVQLATGSLSGPHIDQTRVNTATYLEVLRLQRELLAVVSELELISDEQKKQQVRAFQQKLSQITLRNPSQQVADELRAELEKLSSDLRH